MAAIHATHAARLETGVTAWGDIARLYDMLLAVRPSAVAEVNRAVAVGEARAPRRASPRWPRSRARSGWPTWLPYQAARAGLCAKAGRDAEAAEALRAALALGPAPAERLFLERRLAALAH